MVIFNQMASHPPKPVYLRDLSGIRDQGPGFRFKPQGLGLWFQGPGFWIISLNSYLLIFCPLSSAPRPRIPDPWLPRPSWLKFGPATPLSWASRLDGGPYVPPCRRIFRAPPCNCSPVSPSYLYLARQVLRKRVRQKSQCWWKSEHTGFAPYRGQSSIFAPPPWM